MKKKSTKQVKPWIFWTPRILSILFILFLAMFSLDVFEGNYGFWGALLALFIHNIPVLILTILLVIAWKHEIVGAIAFFLGGIAYTGLVLPNLLADPSKLYMLVWILQIAGPAFFIGILFLIGWLKNKES